MIRRCRNDTFFAKHWLGFRYFLKVNKDSVDTFTLIPQYLFVKDMLDISIGYYNKETQGHASYEITHNKLRFEPNLDQLLTIMKSNPILSDVWEQLAKMSTLFIIPVMLWFRLFYPIALLLLFVWVCRQFKYLPIGMLILTGWFILLQSPYLLPVIIFNLGYIVKIKEDSIYDLFICNSGKYFRKCELQCNA